MTDGRAAVLYNIYDVVYFYFIKHTNTNMSICLCVGEWVGVCVCVYQLLCIFVCLFHITTLRRSSVIIIIIRLYIIYVCVLLDCCAYTCIHNTTIISDSPVLHRTKPGLLACIYIYTHAKQNTTERGSLFVLVFYSILMSSTVYNRMYRVIHQTYAHPHFKIYYLMNTFGF